MSRKIEVQAEPFEFALDPARTALIVIDMQNDFCATGGYMNRMGYDIEPFRKCVTPVKRAVELARESGILVIYTRGGHRLDLADCPPSKLERGRRAGVPRGGDGPTGRALMKGEVGFQIVDELALQAGDLVLDKPATSAFYSTELELILRNRDITHLIITGVTTDCCVHSTLRDGNDMGYWCLLLEDCCAAATEEMQRAAVAMVKMESGILGWVSNLAALQEALSPIA